MNKLGKSMMWMAGIGTASFLSYKYLVPEDKKKMLGDMAKNMVNNKNNSGNN